MGDDQQVVPQIGAVLCIRTVGDGSEPADGESKVVRMDITAVDEGQQVTVNVEAWEPDCVG